MSLPAPTLAGSTCLLAGNAVHTQPLPSRLQSLHRKYVMSPGCDITQFPPPPCKRQMSRTSFMCISKSLRAPAWLAHPCVQLSQKLSPCRSRVFVPNRHTEHPALRSTSARAGNIPRSLDGVSRFVLSQETLIQPHRDRGCENSGNNLKLLSRLSRSHFNSQKSAELDSISSGSTRAGATAASI